MNETFVHLQAYFVTIILTKQFKSFTVKFSVAPISNLAAAHTSKSLPVDGSVAQ